MIASKSLKLIMNSIPSESKFESHFYRNDVSCVISKYHSEVTFHRRRYISW